MYNARALAHGRKEVSIIDKINIEIELLRSGQTKDYGDSVFEAIYTFSSSPSGWTPGRKIVLAIAKAHYGLYDGRGLHEKFEVPGPVPYLEALDQLAENRWRVVVIAPWTD